MHRSSLVAVAVLVLAQAELAQRDSAGLAGERPIASQAGPFSRAEVARFMAEAPRIPEAELAPDGSGVIYAVSRGSVATNEYVIDLLLQRLDPTTGAPQGAPTLVLRRSRADNHGTYAPPFVPRWCPDARCFTYFAAEADSGATASGAGLLRYDLATTRATLLEVRDTAGSAEADSALAKRPRITRVGKDYRWSPRGTYLAFTAPISTTPLDARRGVRVSTDWSGFEAPRQGLFVLEASTGIATQVTADSFHVAGGFDWLAGGFDWSPDETALVFAATMGSEGIPYQRTDLFVVDRASGAARALVIQAGLDALPAWSPDGRWVAFESHFGLATYYGGWPAVVPASGGPIMRLASDDDPKVGGRAPVLWSPDGLGFYYSSAHHMTSRLIRADLTARRVAPMSADERPYDSRFSISADGRWLAFTRESLTSPPELFVQALPKGEPRQITRLAVEFPLRDIVRVDTLSWPSRDRRFQIHALLLTPAEAWTAAGSLAAPLPTLVYMTGGPNMVHRGFATDGHNGAQLPMAARGYAVLMPNTRGRNGYGEAFQSGMRDGSSAARLPYEDMMEGVDLLIRRGIADSSRLGVYGHSYGGYLTSYVVTQTDRFKAAVNHEGHAVEILTWGMYNVPGGDYELLNRDMYGVRNPFDPTERARLIAESPGLNADRVRTPTLLIFGNNAGSARPLLGGLRRFGVPSELVVYAEGHNFQRPAAIADDLEQTVAWLDYWLRGLPYPDAERQRAYDAWQQRRHTY